MPRSEGRTAPCPPQVRQGRMDKAAQFLEAAKLIDVFADHDELSDALVTVCVHAGIAAADVICCSVLGRHARGEDHAQAVALLQTADRDAARHLNALLGMKTLAGYSHRPVGPEDRRRALRATAALVDAARKRG